MYPSSSSIKPSPSPKNTKEDDDRKPNHQNLINSLVRLKEGLGIDLFQKYCEYSKKIFLYGIPFTEESCTPFIDNFNFIEDFIIEFLELDDENVMVAAILLMLDSRSMSEDELRNIFTWFDLLVSERFNGGEKYRDFERLKERFDLDLTRAMSFLDRLNVFDTMYAEVNRILSGHDDLIYVFKCVIEVDDYQFAFKKWVINSVGLQETTDLHMDVLNLMRDGAWFIKDQENQNRNEILDPGEFLNKVNLKCRLKKVFEKYPFFPISVILKNDRLEKLENSEIKWMKEKIRVLSEERDFLKASVVEIREDNSGLSAKLFSSAANVKDLGLKLKKSNLKDKNHQRELNSTVMIDKKHKYEIRSLKEKVAILESKAEQEQIKFQKSLSMRSEAEQEMAARLLEHEQTIRLLTKDNERLSKKEAEFDYKMSEEKKKHKAEVQELKNKWKENKLKKENVKECSSRTTNCDPCIRVSVLFFICIALICVYSCSYVFLMRDL